MNLSMGYYGGVSLSPNVRRNPLQSVPPTLMRFTPDEVNAAVARFGLPPWNTLAPNQRKMVAAFILQTRGTTTSMAQAGQVLLSNPAFQDFQIVSPAPGSVV